LKRQHVPIQVAATGRRAAPAPRVIDRRKSTPRHRRWVLAAFLLPVLFCVVVGIGVYLMWHRQMAFFRPPPVGSAGSARPLADALRHGGPEAGDAHG